MKKALLLITCLFLSFLHTQAQYVFTKLWDKTIGGINEENAGIPDIPFQRVYLLPDGNILIGGSSNSNIGGDKTQSTWGDHDAWLAALDSSTGQVVWDRDYGGLQWDLFGDLTDAGNGNKLLTLTSASTQTPIGNFTAPFLYTHPNAIMVRYLLLDNNWNVVWDRLVAGDCQFRTSRTIWINSKYYLLTYVSGLYNALSDLQDTSCRFSINNNQIAIIAHDSSDNWLWDKAFGADFIISGGNDDQSTDLLPLTGGGFLMSGLTDATAVACTVTDISAGANDINIYRLDSIGNVLWQRCFGGADQEQLKSKLLATSDGNYVFAATTRSLQGGEITQPNPGAGLSLWIVKFDISGAILWDKRYNGCYGVNGINWLRSPIVHTSDGGFLVGATLGSTVTNSDSIPGCDVTEYGRSKQDYWIIKLDGDGNKQWDKRWGGSGKDILHDLMQLPDDSYIASGISYSNISGDKTENNRDASLLTADYWVVRFRADLMVGLEEAWVSDMQLAVSPNPAKDICTITLSNTSTLKHSNTLTLYDIAGRVLVHRPFNAKANLDVSKLSKGVYIVEVRNRDGHSVKGKLVKE